REQLVLRAGQPAGAKRHAGGQPDDRHHQHEHAEHDFNQRESAVVAAYGPHGRQFLQAVPFQRYVRMVEVGPKTVSARAVIGAAARPMKIVPLMILPVSSTSCPSELNMTAVAPPKSMAALRPKASGVSGIAANRKKLVWCSSTAVEITVSPFGMFCRTTVMKLGGVKRTSTARRWLMAASRASLSCHMTLFMLASPR